MNNTEILEKLKIIVKPYVNNEEAYAAMNEDTDFITDLNINSANLVDIILDIEEAFKVVIDNTDMERMLTARATLEIIRGKLQQQ